MSDGRNEKVVDGNSVAQLRAQRAHVFDRRPVMPRPQRDHDVGIARPYGRGGAVGKIDTAVRHADVVHQAYPAPAPE